MDPIKPDVSTFIVPLIFSEVTLAETQQHLGYMPLPVIRTPTRVVSQWKPNDEELKRLFAGDPVTVVMLTSDAPPPIDLLVGGVDLT